MDTGESGARAGFGDGSPIAHRESTKAITLSTESIVSPQPEPTGASTQCPSCGAPLAGDQRYCLECGERRMPMSSFLLGGESERASATPPAPSMLADPGAQRPNSTLTVIAGVGVLLLAMGVGVLIGRSGGSSPGAAPTQVISVAGAASAAPAATSEATFSDDWPSGKKGFTVQLQTLPQSGTSVSTVDSDKSAATAKGAANVGALLSEHFSSLPAGNYLIYSGVYSKRAEAQKALAGLKKAFPGAKVLAVSNASPSSGGAGGKAGVGSSLNNPAPPSVLNNLHSTKGKSYEEKSKNLPDVISTG
jgi:hypothetical protein